MKSKLFLGLAALVLVAPAFASMHEGKKGGHCMADGKEVAEAKDEASCTAMGEGHTWAAGSHKAMKKAKKEAAHSETAAPAAK